MVPNKTLNVPHIDGLLKLRAAIIKLATTGHFFEDQDELTLEEDFKMTADGTFARTEFYVRNCDGGYTIKIDACLAHEHEIREAYEIWEQSPGPTKVLRTGVAAE